MPKQMPDVNVLIYAFSDRSPRYQDAVAWLDSAVGDGSLVLSDLVLSGVLRVLSGTRGAWAGYDPARVLELCHDLRSTPGVDVVNPGSQHWPIFTTLITRLGARGNLVPDCYHAALAIEHDATFVSANAFFAKVPGLRWVNPFS